VCTPHVGAQTPCQRREAPSGRDRHPVLVPAARRPRMQVRVTGPRAAGTRPIREGRRLNGEKDPCPKASNRTYDPDLTTFLSQQPRCEEGPPSTARGEHHRTRLRPRPPGTEVAVTTMGGPPTQPVPAPVPAARRIGATHYAQQWLKRGIEPKGVAERAGHSGDVLLRVYSHYLDGDECEARRRVQRTLDGKLTGPATTTIWLVGPAHLPRLSSRRICSSKQICYNQHLSSQRAWMGVEYVAQICVISD
jgi:hypothetical protein